MRLFRILLCTLPLMAVLIIPIQASAVDVCPGTAYPTIQSGVNAAAAGDTVNVCAGTFVEKVTVTGSAKKSIRIAGTGLGNTYLVCPATTNDGFTITTSGVQITGMDISGCRRAISVAATMTSTVRNNTIHDNDVGVYIAIGGGNLLLLNRFDGNASYAIQTSLSTTDFFVGNTINGTKDNTKLNKGIYLANSGSQSLQYNTVNGTTDAITLSSTSSATIQQNITSDNQTGIVLTGTVLGKSSSNQLLGNLATNNKKFGISVEGKTSNNTMASNLATGNGTDPTKHFDISDKSTGSVTFGTANTWSDNVCNTSSPAGMCSPPQPYEEGQL